MKWSLAPVLCAALCATLPAACTSLGDVPAAQAVLSEGTPTRLGVPVRVGAVVVTPLEVVEDSRCPINARCVWAGRVIVKARIEGADWRETAQITAGTPHGTHDAIVHLVSVQPDRVTGDAVQPGDYRFLFEDEWKEAGF